MVYFAGNLADRLLGCIVRYLHVRLLFRPAKDVGDFGASVRRGEGAIAVLDLVRVVNNGGSNCAAINDLVGRFPRLATNNEVCSSNQLVWGGGLQFVGGES